MSTALECKRGCLWRKRFNNLFFGKFTVVHEEVSLFSLLFMLCSYSFSLKDEQSLSWLMQFKQVASSRTTAALQETVSRL